LNSSGIFFPVAGRGSFDWELRIKVCYFAVEAKSIKRQSYFYPTSRTQLDPLGSSAWSMRRKFAEQNQSQAHILLAEYLHASNLLWFFNTYRLHVSLRLDTVGGDDLSIHGDR
jgi:hypothetical protein